jgi:hypothetical protein
MMPQTCYLFSVITGSLWISLKVLTLYLYLGEELVWYEWQEDQRRASWTDLQF